MPTAKRLVFALALVLFAAHASTLAQRPQLNSVNIAAEENRVRASAQGQVFDLRMEVVDDAGDIVFEGVQAAAEHLDWNMRDAKGTRVSPGTYTVTVSYTTAAGRPRKRVEQVTVTEEVAGATEAEAKVLATGGGASAPEASSSAPNPQPLVDGGGAANRLAKFTDTDTLTSSSLIDLAGRFGVGTLAPRAGWRMEVVGSTLFRPGGTGGELQLSTPNGETGIGWVKGTTSRADIRFNGTALTLAAITGANVPPATNGLSITTAGRVGIGTATPGLPGLHIGAGVPGGQARLQLDNSNGTTGGLNRWTNRLEVASSNAIALSAGGIARPGLWLEPSGSVGIKVFPQSTLHVAGDVTFDYGGNARLYTGTGSTDHNRSLEVRNSQANPLFSGLKVGGITVSYDDAYTIVPERNNLLVRGRAAIGARNTLSGVGLYVVGTSAGVQAETSSGYGLSGAGPGGGIYARRTSNSGYAGYFDGPVQVNGQVCAANVPCSSDARLKQGVSNLNYGLSQMLRLRPVSWRWKSEPHGNLQMGLVAQEVEQVLPELVLRGADPSQPLGLNYMALLPVAVKAIQEQQTQIREQQRQIERLQVQLNQVRRGSVRRGRKK